MKRKIRLIRSIRFLVLFLMAVSLILVMAPKVSGQKEIEIRDVDHLRRLLVGHWAVHLMSPEMNRPAGEERGERVRPEDRAREEERLARERREEEERLIREKRDRERPDKEVAFRPPVHPLEIMVHEDMLVTAGPERGRLVIRDPHHVFVIYKDKEKGFEIRFESENNMFVRKQDEDRWVACERIGR